VASQLFDEAKKITRSEGLDYLNLGIETEGLKNLPSRRTLCILSKRNIRRLGIQYDGHSRENPAGWSDRGRKPGFELYKFGREELLPGIL